MLLSLPLLQLINFQVCHLVRNGARRAAAAGNEQQHVNNPKYGGAGACNQRWQQQQPCNGIIAQCGQEVTHDAGGNQQANEE